MVRSLKKTQSSYTNNMSKNTVFRDIALLRFQFIFLSLFFYECCCIFFRVCACQSVFLNRETVYNVYLFLLVIGGRNEIVKQEQQQQKIFSSVVLFEAVFFFHTSGKQKRIYLIKNNLQKISFVLSVSLTIVFQKKQFK